MQCAVHHPPYCGLVKHKVPSEHQEYGLDPGQNHQISTTKWCWKSLFYGFRDLNKNTCAINHRYTFLRTYIQYMYEFTPTYTPTNMYSLLNTSTVPQRKWKCKKKSFSLIFVNVRVRTLRYVSTGGTERVGVYMLIFHRLRRLYEDDGKNVFFQILYSLEYGEE